MSLLLPVYFAHHGLDIHGSRGGSGLGLLHLFLLPDDDGVDAWASVPSILLQLGRTNVETETDGCKTCSRQKNSIVTSGLEAGLWITPDELRATFQFRQHLSQSNLPYV